MLNTIWAVMILIGVAVGILTGNMEAVNCSNSAKGGTELDSVT